MSFINIKDPVERDAKVADYVATVKRLQQRNLEERSDLAACQRHLEESFKPIVASNQKMAQDIIKDLIPIKEELKDRNRTIGILQKEHLEDDFGSASPEKRFKTAPAHQ